MRSGAGAQPGGDRGPGVARRDPQPPGAGGALPPVAPDPVRYRARAEHDRRLGGPHDGRHRRARRGGAPARADPARHGRGPAEGARHDRGPAGGPRHRHAGLVAPRPPRRRRRPAQAGAGGARGPGRGARPGHRRAPGARPGSVGLRGRPGLAALHALARARGGELRPAAVPGGAAPHRLGHRAPSRRLRRGRRAVLRLARGEPGLAGRLADERTTATCTATPTVAARTWR